MKSKKPSFRFHIFDDCLGRDFEDREDRVDRNEIVYKKPPQVL
jgi:hypothetical protein